MGRKEKHNKGESEENIQNVLKLHFICVRFCFVHPTCRNGQEGEVLNRGCRETKPVSLTSLLSASVNLDNLFNFCTIVSSSL